MRVVIRLFIPSYVHVGLILGQRISSTHTCRPTHTCICSSPALWPRPIEAQDVSSRVRRSRPILLGSFYLSSPQNSRTQFVLIIDLGL